MAGSALQLAVDEPSKKRGRPLSLNNLPLSHPRLDRQQGQEQNNCVFYFLFAITVTVPFGTLNMHLKFKMPQMDTIKALSMHTF